MLFQSIDKLIFSVYGEVGVVNEKVPELLQGNGQDFRLGMPVVWISVNVRFL